MTQLKRSQHSAFLQAGCGGTEPAVRCYAGQRLRVEESLEYESLPPTVVRFFGSVERVLGFILQLGTMPLRRPGLFHLSAGVLIPLRAALRSQPSAGFLGVPSKASEPADSSG
jgi:hypothetical protein